MDWGYVYFDIGSVDECSFGSCEIDSAFGGGWSFLECKSERRVARQNGSAKFGLLKCYNYRTCHIIGST